MELGTLGVFASLESLPAAEAATFANRVEGWGYGTLWIPEGGGRDSFTSAGWLLAKTTTLNIGTAIANIYARDPVNAAQAQNALGEQSGGRFQLGLGVSHERVVEGMHKHEYRKPIETMRGYLHGMAEAPYHSVRPADKPKTIIAALGPKMAGVAAELADGLVSVNATPEHTAQARRILGPDKLLCVVQAIMLGTDPARARALGRRTLEIYLSLPNYLKHWKRLGFDAADFENGGSDRLVDAMIAWGDEQAIRARIEEQWKAGADHVCIRSLVPNDNDDRSTDENLLALLAPRARRAAAS